MIVFASSVAAFAIFWLGWGLGYWFAVASRRGSNVSVASSGDIETEHFHYDAATRTLTAK